MKSIDEFVFEVSELNDAEGGPDVRLSVLLNILENKDIELMLVPKDYIDEIKGVLNRTLQTDIKDTVPNNWTKALSHLQDD